MSLPPELREMIGEGTEISAFVSMMARIGRVLVIDRADVRVVRVGFGGLQDVIGDFDRKTGQLIAVRVQPDPRNLREGF